jgi:hypothetical protein
MNIIKCGAALVLVLLLGGLGWVLTHLRKIKRDLIADEAMPKPGPRTNLLILLIVVFTGLSSLLITFLVH